MTYNNNYAPGNFGTPGSGFASRGKGSNPKRLSVALPPKVNSINEDQIDNPTPRTSRSHLLAGLRTAPKSANGPASAPFSQNNYNGQGASQWDDEDYSAYAQGGPQSAMGAGFGNNQYVMNAGQQTYSLPEQVLAPPSFYDQDEEMDPNVLEQLHLTRLFLAQRQQQLQQQLANITAAANQFQGMDAQFMQQQSMQQFMPQYSAYGQQQMQQPMEVPGQPGLYLLQNPMTGQFQYVTEQSISQQYQQQQQQQQQQPQRNSSPASRSQTLYNTTSSPMSHESPRPTFRAEISPPPTEKATPVSSRSITPPKKSSSPASAAEHVQPLPPPSANAFRRGHKKASSLAFSNLAGGASDGPKTASTATFGSARAACPAGPLTGTFGPGAARAGEHPMRQPRGPPPLEELVALPTAKHEGSKNFAARQRRRALSSLVRAGSFRRGVSGSPCGTPTSESDLHFSEEDEYGMIRKQSPIGSERSAKRGSGDSYDSGSAVQTPASEEGNVFDMRSFVKQLPAHMQQQVPERRKMMLGVLNSAEKRKSLY